MPHKTKMLSALVGATLLALALPSPPAAAEDGVIRVGMTLRMIVENGLKYGQLTRDELLGVTPRAASTATRSKSSCSTTSATRRRASPTPTALSSRTRCT